MGISRESFSIVLTLWQSWCKTKGERLVNDIEKIYELMKFFFNFQNENAT